MAFGRGAGLYAACSYLAAASPYRSHGVDWSAPRAPPIDGRAARGCPPLSARFRECGIKNAPAFV